MCEETEETDENWRKFYKSLEKRKGKLGNTGGKIKINKNKIQEIRKKKSQENI